MGFAETFKALADSNRREILTMLKSGRMSAGEIASKFNMTNATISYHLSQLKKADLITETKEKNFIYYELNISVFEEIMLWIAQFKEDSNEE
ncbi:MAG: winged helix-turn-helix transcriptional regulator [Oscillospiraceae bacterium]|nr:winged helix-turn-helix transcriptional regulator [Oscillospiraceae bacterium]